MKRGLLIASILVLTIGGILWFSNRNDSATTPTASPSSQGTSSNRVVPADALTKKRLNEIEAAINKQGSKSEKLKSQASVIVPTLREKFLAIDTPINNITFSDDIIVNGSKATVSSTGADGTAYTAVLAYVNDPLAGNESQWLVLYTEVK